MKKSHVSRRCWKRVKSILITNSITNHHLLEYSELAK